MYKAVLFDLDGTLLDTSAGIKKSVEYTIHEMKLKELTENEIIEFIGPPIYSSFKEKYNMNDDAANVATEIFRDVYKNKFLFEVKIYDHVFEVFKYLKKMNIKIGIATYKREDYTLKLLKHLGIHDLCDSIVGSDMKNELTKTDIVKICIDNLCIENYSDAVLVGDTHYDAIGAYNLGLDFIGVTFGFGFKTVDDINRYSNVGCINTMNELINYI